MYLFSRIQSKYENIRARKKSVFGLFSRRVLLLVNLINTEDSNWHMEFEHKLSNETF